MVEQRANRSGRALGPYQLTRLLGAGGFGEVYEADHRLLQQKRAIKLLLERHFHDPTQRERFLREARTLATLEHPNILPVLEVGEEGTVLYLVMPFYHRGTLNDLLKPRTTPLPLTVVERLLAQMCAAVGYAHGRHIAHLDLKPENMLLHEDGRLVLSDFGLAHLIKQGRLEAGSSASWGTPYYMAPEQIRGEPEPRSDLYALGVILYQLLTTQRPFTGTTPEAVMMKHLLEVPPPLHATSPETPATLEPVLQKALKKQPEDRYATAEALLADFRAAVSSRSPQLAQPSAPSVFPAVPTPMNDPTPVVQPTIPVPPNKTQTTAAVCEVDNCGILAVGRCTTCKRAFCSSHQALTREIRYVDMCAPCFAKQQAEWEARGQAPADSPRRYFPQAAKTDLLTAGVPTVEIYEVRSEWKPGRFRGGRYVDVVTTLGSGWILGTFDWGYYKPSRYDRELVAGDWLTALLCEGPSWMREPNAYYAFIRVTPHPPGYRYVRSDGDVFSGDLEEARQAVKRLIRESN